MQTINRWLLIEKSKQNVTIRETYYLKHIQYTFPSMVFCYPFLLYLTRLMGLEFKWIRLTKSYYFYHAHLLLFGQHYTEIPFTSIKWANVNEMDIRKLTLSPLTHWGRDKMAAISQTALWNPFSWMKIFEFRLKFDWRLFLRFQLIIFQHWFR